MGDNFNKAAHVTELEKTLNNLMSVATKLVHPAPVQLQLLGATVDITAGSVTSAYNAISDTPKRIRFDNSDNWVQLMRSVHRTFFSSLQSVTEQGLKEFCTANELTVANSRRLQLEKVTGKLDQRIGLTTREKRKLLSFVSPRPEFMDFVKLATHELARERQRHWRFWFQAMAILRNISSHSNRDLVPTEIEILGIAGFGSVVEGTEISLSSSIYVPIIENTVSFFNEILAP